MDRIWRVAILSLGVWACVEPGVGGVEVVGGVVNNLVIAVDPLMEVDVFKPLVLNLEDMVIKMADAMYTSTEGRLALGSVKLVLPIGWNLTNNMWNLTMDVEEAQEGLSWRAADVRLVEPPAKKSHAPNTLQAGQCGVPGRYITLHTTFVDHSYAEDNYGPQGEVFMHEWAHYRWGAWEEYGYPGDPVYPSGYQSEDGFTRPTTCLHGHLEGKFETAKGVSCEPDDMTSLCYFFPDSNSTAATAMASIMSLTYLSEGSFCNSTTHDPWAPTPQNQLCGRRSLWELLNTHPDFIDTKTGSTTPQVTISLHKSPQAKIFFLFDAPDNQEDINYTKSLVSYIVSKNTDRYGSLQLGLATFRTNNMDQTEFTKKLDISTVTNFQSINNYMPDQDDRLVNDTMPLGEAVMEVVGELQEYHPGTLLVVAAMHTLAQDQADFVDTEALLKKKIKLLVFSPNELETIAPLLPTLQDSGGNFYAGSRPVSSEALKSDMDSYLEAHTIDDHYLYGVSRFSVAVGKNTSLPVVILDNSRSKQVNARVTIANFAEDSIEIYLVNPMYGKPILCGRPTSTNEMECYHENIDSGVFVHFPTMTTPDPSAEYKVLLKNTGSTTVEGDVTWSVVSMDVSSPQIVVDVWSSEDAGVKAGIPESNNLILFCQISHVSGVLENITVQAKVELNNGTDTVERLLTMLDDGPGDVDVRARDTVWSAQVEGDWPPGTTLTVTELAINNKPQNFSPFASISSSLERKVRAGESGGVGGSGVMPIDPTKGYCCGSYSNAAKSRITEVNMYLLRPYSITFTHHIQELPVRIKELKLAPEPPVMKGDTWEVSITWTRNVTTTDSTDSIWIRYGLTISAVGDNFLSASAPLNGSDQVSAVSKRCVAILPNTGDDVYIAVAYYDATDGRVGVPSLPVFVQVENAVTLPPTTTTASTSTTTTPSTTTAATTTPTTTTTTTTISTTTVEVTTTKGASTATLAFSCVVVAALAMLS